MPKRYVITGAPGAGKTALVRGLQERGWSVVDEAATEVIGHMGARPNIPLKELFEAQGLL